MSRSKKIKIKDPQADREARKYEHPIPSREFLLKHLNEHGKPVTYEQLIAALDFNMEREQEALRRRLRAMERDGQIFMNRRGGYGLPKKMDLIRGRVEAHPEGYGFVVADTGGKDLFLSTNEMRSVFHHDVVLVRVASVDRRGRRQACVVEVLERPITEIVGRLTRKGKVGFVESANKRITQDILVPEDSLGSAKDGQIVTVSLIFEPNRRAQPIGRVIEVLGEHMAPGMEVDVALRSFDIPHKWSDEVMDEIIGIGKEVLDEDKEGRKDLRELPFVTIDGEDAKDFDDAVYCEKRDGGGWRLYVSIADVSHYVIPGTALDDEAQERGTSVYFPGRVVPMLPKVLSNGLCSLKPNRDRLCISCEMLIDAQGKLTRSQFHEAVMFSHARLTYTQVAKYLEKEKQVPKEHRHVLPHLKDLYDLFKVLRKRRETRGAIDFETSEPRIVFGPKKKIEKIVPMARNDAHKLIEECMLMANVCAAKFLIKNKIPGLFRVHESPTDEKVEDFHEFLGELGLSLKGGDSPQPANYSDLLRSTADRPDSHLIATVLLRSLQQAYYTPENKGHFGLAYDAYGHFTSPIRRYPDLLLHRAIRHILSGKAPRSFAHKLKDMEAFGQTCSIKERRADEAVRDAVSWLKCEYMQDKVGDEFDGIITGVTNFGIFVELKGIYVEGLVHVTSLENDYYHFDPVRHRLVGERTRSVYRLGDPVRVMVARANLDDRKIDFELAQSELKPKGKGRKSGKGAKR